MKYIVTTEPGRLSPGDYYAVLTTGVATKDPALAFRHARAMLEVQRAAKVWAVAARAMERSYERDELCSAAAPKVKRAMAAEARLLKAHDRLKRIEKEVSRG